jgi:chromosome segregation ATPase
VKVNQEDNMAKNAEVRPTRDMEYRRVLCEIAVSQHRVSQLQDQLSPQRQAIAECEAHITGLRNALRSPAEGVATQDGRLRGAPAKFAERAEARQRLAAETNRLPILQEQLAAAQKEIDQLYPTLAKNHRRRVEIEQQIDAEMTQRVKGAVEAAGVAAATARDTCRSTRQKLWRMSAALKAIQTQIGALMTTGKPEEALAARAAAYAETEQMPSEKPEFPDEYKRLIAEERTLVAAIVLQEKLLRDAVGKYGREMAQGTRVRQSELGTRISDALDVVRSCGRESDALRTAVAIEVGDDANQLSVRFGGISPDYSDSDDPVRSYQRTLRLTGLLV